MTLLSSTGLIVLLWLTTCVHAYTWPDAKIDPIEDLYVSPGFVGPILFCNGTFPSGPGTQTAAEWLRTAYHDMATADVEQGTGGIDASIGFETLRDENKGAAFNNTIQLFFAGFLTPAVSMADLIALGAVVAVRSCGGPDMIIPLRVGRVDATEAGPPGVPEPQQDLDSHTAAFKRQGFNTTEMIGLVACGHTIGGIHGGDFPDIVSGVANPDALGETDHFDSSFDVFDNRIATTFVSNTSVDPLVIGSNTTTNSDFRIFNADNGALMKDFANSNEFFLKSCVDLLERMINTVPRGVQLSEPITPIPVKPVNPRLELVENGTSLALFGQVRVTAPPAGSQAPSVFLHVNRADGSSCSDCPVIPTTIDEFPITDGFFGDFNVYDYNDTNVFPLTGGFSSVNVEIREAGGSRTADNGGHGFPIDDSILFQLADSCLHVQLGTRNVTIAVKDSLNLASLSLQWFEADSLVSGTGITFHTNEASFVKGSSIAASGYTSWVSNSEFTPFDQPEAFNSFYSVVGKDNNGKDFNFLGIQAQQMPICFPN